MDSQHLGWLSCVICLIFTLRCAAIFAKTNVNIYFALTVYAAQWGALIVYFSSMTDNENNLDCKHLPEFLPALSGYCCAIVGSMVYRDHNKNISKNVLLREKFFSWLLLFMVLPEGLELLKLHEYNVNHHDIEVFVTFILKSVSFYSLFLATKASTEKKAKILVIGSFLFIYWLLEISYTFVWLHNKHILLDEKIVMNDFFLYGFSIIKILTTVTFIPIALTHCPEYKKLSKFQVVQHFFHLN